MTLEEAKQIFNISNIPNEEELGRIYKTLAMLFHPDSHPENNKEYTEKMQMLNDAYKILKLSVNNLNKNTTKFKNEEYEINKQIKKEQILTEIVVKSYYQSQNEINKLKNEMLNQYINKVCTLNINREKILGSILEPITVEIAHKEAEIINSFIRKNVSSFIEEYGLKINDTSNRNSFLYMFEPLYFLDIIPDWYEKVSTKDNCPKISKK